MLLRWFWRLTIGLLMFGMWVGFVCGCDGDVAVVVVVLVLGAEGLPWVLVLGLLLLFNVGV